jgi:hypothetical protein
VLYMTIGDWCMGQELGAHVALESGHPRFGSSHAPLAGLHQVEVELVHAS